jgi:hypothetical protein
MINITDPSEIHEIKSFLFRPICSLATLKVTRTLHRAVIR